MSLVLFSGTKNASGWAFRAWLALREQKLTFEEKAVDTPKPQPYKNLERIGNFFPLKAFPVLVDKDIVILDCLTVMQYANEI